MGKLSSTGKENPGIVGRQISHLYVDRGQIYSLIEIQERCRFLNYALEVKLGWEICGDEVVWRQKHASNRN